VWVCATDRVIDFMFGVRKQRHTAFVLVVQRVFFDLAPGFGSEPRPCYRVLLLDGVLPLS